MSLMLERLGAEEIARGNFLPTITGYSIHMKILRADTFYQRQIIFRTTLLATSWVCVCALVSIFHTLPFTASVVLSESLLSLSLFT